MFPSDPDAPSEKSCRTCTIGLPGILMMLSFSNSDEYRRRRRDFRRMGHSTHSAGGHIQISVEELFASETDKIKRRMAKKHVQTSMPVLGWLLAGESASAVHPQSGKNTVTLCLNGNDGPGCRSGDGLLFHSSCRNGRPRRKGDMSRSAGENASEAAETRHGGRTSGQDTFADLQT